MKKSSATWAFKVLSWILLGATVVGFQNCSPGFEVLRQSSGQRLGGDEPSDRPYAVNYEISPTPFERLSESRLSGMVAGDGVNFQNFWQFAPRYPLFSYGASKRRWIYLPVNATVANQDPDAWVFPTGTVLWKEFSVEGKKVETRVFEKVRGGSGFASWRSTVYLWRADQTDADLQTVDDFYSLPENTKQFYQAGLVADRYRLVSLSQCIRCHTNTSDVALGFNYFQLSNEYLNRNVLALSQRGIFTNPVQKFDEIAGSDAQKTALGYIQSNCAHCHSGAGPGPHNFRHKSTMARIEDEAIYQSNVLSPGLFTPGNPSASRIFLRISGGTMPPGTLSADSVGVSYIRDWIATFSN